MRWFVVPIMGIIMAACSRDVSDNELLIQDVEIADGVYVQLVHTSRCRLKPRDTDEIINKLDYHHYKYTLFHSCLRDEEADAVVKIGIHNNTDLKEKVTYGYYEVTSREMREHYKRMFNAFSYETPDFDTRYARKGDHEIVEMDSIVNSLDLLYKIYGRFCDFLPKHLKIER